jgi:hypothetical protein
LRSIAQADRHAIFGNKPNDIQSGRHHRERIPDVQNGALTGADAMTVVRT